MGHEGTEGVAYPADREGRLEAGFTPTRSRSREPDGGKR
jgi:hypothetical protein